MDAIVVYFRFVGDFFVVWSLTVRDGNLGGGHMPPRPDSGGHKMADAPPPKEFSAKPKILPKFTENYLNSSVFQQNETKNLKRRLRRRNRR